MITEHEEQLVATAHEEQVVAEVPKGLYIGGQWVRPPGGPSLSVADPATGRSLAEVADAEPREALRALDAAVAAQESFAGMRPRDRGEILRRSYELIIERQDDLALLMTLEMGKPLLEARAEVAYAAEFFRWFAEEAVRVDGGYAAAPASDARLLVMRQPVGPCLLVTPWNFPMAMGTRKIGPAVAAGCTMVVKPAEQTPLSTLVLADLMTEAGLPPGVLNIITTSDPGPVVSALLADGRLRKLSFTGSTEVGTDLLSQAARHVLRVSMELGGNAPFLVFADADLDEAVEGAVIAKMRNAGQACTSANRFLVHERVAPAFTDRLARRMNDLVVGRGTDPRVQVGPLIDRAAQAKVSGLVADAAHRGATVRRAEGPVPTEGTFYPPTLVTGIPSQARVHHEEIFGPVAAVATFEDEEEAVRRANDTSHGLVAYAYTGDLRRALRISERLESGMVGLNTGLVSDPAAPFGGVKASGIGREGGRIGILEYLETKYVAIGSL